MVGFIYFVKSIVDEESDEKTEIELTGSGKRVHLEEIDVFMRVVEYKGRIEWNMIYTEDDKREDHRANNHKN